MQESDPNRCDIDAAGPAPEMCYAVLCELINGPRDGEMAWLKIEKDQHFPKDYEGYTYVGYRIDHSAIRMTHRPSG